MKVAVDNEAAALVQAMNTTGYGVLPDFLGSDELRPMRTFVARAIADGGGHYVGFTGPDGVVGSGLNELSNSDRFKALIAAVYELGTGQPAVPEPFYQVLRCLTGKGMVQHSYLFHYDSYVVTVLIPIEIPNEGQAGDLLMIPNMRPVRSAYIVNILDKLLLDNKLSQIALRKLMKFRPQALTRIKMVPGNAYFFWGYRSIHTNEPCDPDKVRATALFHYRNPHAGAALYGRRMKK